MLRRQLVQPCQKQPSTKTATRAERKAKSGFPRIEPKCLLHPVMPFDKKIRLTEPSVEAFPLDFTAAMIFERRRLETVSTPFSTLKPRLAPRTCRI